MAEREPILTPEQVSRIKGSSKPGRTSSQGVERVSSDSNSIRDKESASKEQSSPPNRRDDGSRREREAEERGPKGDRKLSEPSAQSNPFTASSDILKTIASRFNTARELSRAAAWRQIQVDLMNASPFICPGIIPYKDLIQIVADIEKEIKGSSVQGMKSQEELLANFLNGGEDLTSNPSSPPTEPIDTSATMNRE